MAAELGITAGAYAKIERGETDPSATRLLQIAEFLEVEVAIFFEGIGPSANKKLSHHEKLPELALRREIELLAQSVRQLNLEIVQLRAEILANKKLSSRRKGN